MKIYFAGSIRGGREDATLYAQIIDILKKYGRVPTEHVGETRPGGAENGLSDRGIYERDMDWLEEADVMVAEVTVPSHGVGYEIARADELGLPILCLHRPTAKRRLSALIAGNPAIRCESYEHVSQLDVILGNFLRRQGIGMESPE